MKPAIIKGTVFKRVAFKSTIRVLLASVVAASAQAADPERADDLWLGKVVPPYASGYHETSGTCIGDLDRGGDSLCGWSVQVVQDGQSKLRTILVLEHAPHFGDKPLWFVRDALEPTQLDDRNAGVVMGLCQKDGKDDSRIVAIVDTRARTEWIGKLRRVWRIDTSGRLQPIKSTGIRCRNEGFGYDG